MPLVEVADCAYPTDWSDLPASVKVVLGYVGDPYGTPHVWTVDEIASVHRAKRAWAPIWTPPQPPFDHAAGVKAGAGMIHALLGLGYSKRGPVFLDIEQGTWSAAPNTVRGGIDAWKAELHKAGWSRTYAYVPAAAQFDWVADWVGSPPQHLAPGVVGVQYQGNADQGRYDWSVFDSAVFADLFTPSKGPAMTLTQADKDWITAQVANPVHQLAASLVRLYADGDPKNPRPFALIHLAQKLDQLLADVNRPRPVAVDTAKLATELGAHLAVETADQVAEVLATRLAKG